MLNFGRESKHTLNLMAPNVGAGFPSIQRDQTPGLLNLPVGRRESNAFFQNKLKNRASEMIHANQEQVSSNSKISDNSVEEKIEMFKPQMHPVLEQSLLENNEEAKLSKVKEKSDGLNNSIARIAQCAVGIIEDDDVSSYSSSHSSQQSSSFSSSESNGFQSGFALNKEMLVILSGAPQPGFFNSDKKPEKSRKIQLVKDFPKYFFDLADQKAIIIHQINIIKNIIVSPGIEISLKQPSPETLGREFPK